LLDLEIKKLAALITQEKSKKKKKKEIKSQAH
jgi:hypothetical protein